ncbi:MAG: glycosyltransferase family 2 protein [Sinobacteraceae bacterium]|nr:glycosyltransferase family 2 protein [Nevskiaceae bacterium]MCP5470719.1 glycosyltransferase family 2 protein [Nevskiaceae bacterium]
MSAALQESGTPSVSVVVPTYNYGRFLPRALDSVLAQSFAPSEIIVVDDGSTDDTRDVLTRYREPVQVVHQTNRGLPAARNAGIRLARGELIALLDSDDAWHPNKLQQQIALWRRHPECGAIGCGVQVVDAEGRPIRTVLFEDAAGDANDRVHRIALRRSWVGGSGSGALIPVETFRQVGGFDESLSAAEDWDMWLRIAAKYPVRNVREALSQIWDHRGGTFRGVAKLRINQMAVLGKIEREPSLRLSAATRRRIHAMILSDAAGEAFGGGDWKSSAAYALRSASLWPLSAKSWHLLAGSSLRWLAGIDRTGA